MGSPAFYTMVLKYMKVGQHYYSMLVDETELSKAWMNYECY